LKPFVGATDQIVQRRGIIGIFDLGGAIAGGVITYDSGQGQKIAVAAGMTSPIWPTPKINGKVVVLGL